jgi:DNA mismatch repair protein MutS
VVSAKRHSPSPDDPVAGATPLIRQYHAIKARHPDHIVFFRCGDFYEMFFDDARTAASVLGITLTSRGTDPQGNPVPLAGIPYHSLEPYLARMIRAGLRVAICEQMENPKHAKGVVKREVVRVVTPGTVVEDALLDNKSNNYLVGLVEDGGYGLAALDFSTGQFEITEFRGSGAAAACAIELARRDPAEVVVARSQRETLAAEFYLEARREDGLLAPNPAASQAPAPVRGSRVAVVEDFAVSPHAARDALLRQLGVRDLAGFGAEDTPLAVRAAAAVLEYLRDTQRAQMVHLRELRVCHPGEHMVLDATTQRSLELVQNLNDASRRNTLLEVLDRTSTPMGGRELRSWILQPLRDRQRITERLDAVEALARDHRLRRDAAERLRQVSDLERIVSRCACKTANARDLLGLRRSLEQLPRLRETVQAAGAPAALADVLATPPETDALLGDLAAALAAALVDEPPVSVREGGMIRPGYSVPLDELRTMATDSKAWIAAMRQQEIERTGIPNLKIGFNKVFGYFIEVTKAQADKVPAHYVRKQTIAGGERYITPELKEKEEIILHAEERAQELEFELFEQLRARVCDAAGAIQRVARAIARFDALTSLAEVASANNYCRPSLATDGTLTIFDGRHPVLETLDLDQPFVPNDAHLDPEAEQILIITGPNMAGKSTYIRQVALITLMAHMGSFVPAREAVIPPVDRIFTRVGAMDQLARGQSTFLVEMSETANILNNATDASLVILDEIGRGTSTYDGLSIAWSVIEYLHNTPGRRPKTLFATHYHELAQLEGPLPRVRNFNVAVVEEEDRVAFLYKIVRGSTDHSYGIYAAQVAGLPRAAIERAREILAQLEDGREVSVAAPEGGGLHAAASPRIEERFVQLTLFDAAEHPVVERLRSVDPNQLTPLDALALVAELVKEARRRP